MRNLLTIVGFTIKQAVTKKSFIIINIIMIAVILLVCNIPNIINVFDSENGDSEDTADTVKIGIVDEGNLIGLRDEKILKTDIGYELEYIETGSLEDWKNKLSNEEIDAILTINKAETGELTYKYLIKEESIFADTMSTMQDVSSIAKSMYINPKLIQDNVSQELINAINAPVVYETETLADDAGNNNFGIAMATAFILFFAIYFYGYSVSTAISSEKTSRVMETLVTSTTPTKIVLGKTIGMGIVGLSQLVTLILVAVLGYIAFIPEEFDFVKPMLETMNITPFAVLICLVYFVLGYTIYAFIAAVTGATVSKAEDVQAASGPISMIALISFYLAYFTATVPNSSASKFASIFPFSAAFSMPGRIFAGSATGTEIGISIAVLLVTTVLLAYISIKVYKIAILHYGNRLKLSSLFKMYKTEK